jgi:hypothetical protein
VKPLKLHITAAHHSRGLLKGMQMLLPDSLSLATAHQIALIGGIMLEVPLCILGSFKFLAVFSFAGCTSTLVVMLLVAALPALDPIRECLVDEPQHTWLRPGIFTATGIFAVCPPRASTHTCRPMLPPMTTVLVIQSTGCKRHTSSG